MFGGDGKWEKRLEKPWNNSHPGFYLPSPLLIFWIWVVSRWSGTAGLLELRQRNCAKMHRCNLRRTWRIPRCSNYLNALLLGQQRMKEGNNMHATLQAKSIQIVAILRGKTYRIYKWWCPYCAHTLETRGSKHKALLVFLMGKDNAHNLLKIQEWHGMTSSSKR